MEKSIPFEPELSEIPVDKDLDQLKEYKRPKLKSYGGISDLVQMNFGAGGDGGGPPLQFS